MEFSVSENGEIFCGTTFCGIFEKKNDEQLIETHEKNEVKMTTSSSQTDLTGFFKVNLSSNLKK